MGNNKFAKYDDLTKFRAIFVVSIGLLQPWLPVIDLEESFFSNLVEFTRLKMKENPKHYLPLLLKIRPSIKIDNIIKLYEDEKSVQDLYEITDQLNSRADYYELLNSGIDDEDVDDISSLAEEYVNFLNSFYDNYVPSLLPN